MTHINPVKDLQRELCSVQNPVRYLGGEFGQIKKDSAELTFALAFPDLYEIAMSNHAIKILYDGLNKISSVRCERVFAPAPDFEAILKAKSTPLYTLESGIPLYETDIIGVSIGYEPGITGLLAILDTGGVPLLNSHRKENHPIVLAGGCGITNPLPFSSFIDAFFIGEAEAGLFELIEDMSIAKQKGAKRKDLLEKLSAHPSIWTLAKDNTRLSAQSCARRAVYSSFGSPQDTAVCFPVPGMRIVQDHGNVEIMRGCPNGCRFCHAGLYYRPQRMMDINRILKDVEFLVDEGGYNEISLMSLSSGDYQGIDDLLTVLTNTYANRNISFQLPSLKVNSFTLPLLKKVSEVRKSGLTFAVETPVDAWQMALNKEVYKDRIIDIIREAKKQGWNKAKFYFMVGLPVEKDGLSEEEEIVNFLLEIQAKTRIQCNVNVGTFIPKPHTPYQWSKQLSMEESKKKLDYIYHSLPKGKFKVSTHKPFNSFLEGMLSRGDRRVGDIILSAYKAGCRLDAWEDWAKPEVWASVIANADWDVEAETIRERDLNENLPWDGVSLGVSKGFLKKEKIRSDEQILTSSCATECIEPCGVCGNNTSVHTISSEIQKDNPAFQLLPTERLKPPVPTHRVLISYKKTSEAAYIPHLGLVEIWHKAFQRSSIPVIFTEGFNPVPRFEIAQSLSLGISSENEIASFLLPTDIDSDKIKVHLNKSLPDSLVVTEVLIYPISIKCKRESLSKYLWGNTYCYSFYEYPELDVQNEIINYFNTNFSGISIEQVHEKKQWIVTVPFVADRPLRDMLAEKIERPIYDIVSINKLQSLSLFNSTENSIPVSFFTTFAKVAEENSQQL